MFAIAITIIVFFIDIVFWVIITLINNYKRKQFVSIKNNGVHFEGVILTADKSCVFGQHKWIWKDSGDITVSANNKTYKITNIDYNKEFKLLKQKLEDDFYSNKQSYINLNQSFEKNDILYKVHRKEITVGIYVLDNKAVADLDSIKIN